MSVQTAANAVTARNVIAGIKARVAADYTGTVRVVVAPNPTGPDYVAQEGVTIRVPVAEPFPQSGAGRAGFVVHRRVEIFVASMSLADPAGEDENGAYAHLDLEELVANAVHDFPNRSPELAKLGIKVRWVPGGEEIARQTKRQDTGLMLSVLLFDVEYVQPFGVNRS